MSGRIRVERSANVLRIIVDRPERANALDSAQLVALREAFESVPDHARVVVLTGGGEATFVGGADLDELASLGPDNARAFITRVHQACDAARRCPVPVIARIQGPAIGAGLELAAACDLRIAAQTATFVMPEVRFGIPSVVEAALLPRLIGRGRAAWLLLSAQPIDAATALSWGLVERIVPPGDLDEAVEEAIAALLETEPFALREQKRLLNYWDEHPLAAGIAESIESLAACYRTPEPARRIAAFRRTRPGTSR